MRLFTIYRGWLPYSEIIGFLPQSAISLFFDFPHLSRYKSPMFRPFFNGNRSGSHQGTKTQRIDMNFAPLSEKEERIARKIVE